MIRSRLFPGSVKCEDPKPVFVFSSQGNQWPGMGRWFYRTQPIFREVIGNCNEETERYLGFSLLEEFQTERLKALPPEEPERTQPRTTALQIALYSVFRSY